MRHQPPANDDEEHIPTLRTYLGAASAVVAALLLAWFAMEFADWNKQQSCVLSGRKNCVPAVSHSTR